MKLRLGWWMVERSWLDEKMLRMERLWIVLGFE